VREEPGHDALQLLLQGLDALDLGDQEPWRCGTLGVTKSHLSSSTPALTSPSARAGPRCRGGTLPQPAAFGPPKKVKPGELGLWEIARAGIARARQRFT